MKRPHTLLLSENPLYLPNPGGTSEAEQLTRCGFVAKMGIRISVIVNLSLAKTISWDVGFWQFTKAPGRELLNGT